jgi:cytochrome c biogenesis protein CcmG/thiol:disulfide interchange protein DsbE
MTRWLIPLLIFGALVAFLVRGLNLNPREVPSPLIDKPAPAFAAPTLADPARRLKREEMRGRVWLLNVWASWCGPCREEHAQLMRLSQRQPTVTIVGLNYKDERDAASQWLQQWGNPYTESLVDPQGLLGLDFGVYGVPETFIIDRDGIVRFKHVGPITPRVLRDKIEPALKRLGA